MIIKNLVHIKEINAITTFIPPMVDMSLWLKGDAGVNGGTAVNGDPVSTWQDQSGQGNDFIQGVFVRQPTFIEPGLNSRKGLSFTSPNFLSNSAGLFTADEGVVFVACKKNAPATGGQFGNVFVLGSVSHTVPATKYTSMVAVDTLAGFVSGSYSVNYNNPALDLSYGLSGTVGTLLTIKKTNTDLEARRDGVIVNTGTGVNTLGNLYNSIGQYYSFNQTFEGEIYEIIIYETLISDADIIKVENYLKSKYAIP